MEVAEEYMKVVVVVTDNGDGAVADADMDVAVTVAMVQLECRGNNDGRGGSWRRRSFTS